MELPPGQNCFLQLDLLQALSFINQTHFRYQFFLPSFSNLLRQDKSLSVFASITCFFHCILLHLELEPFSLKYLLLGLRGHQDGYHVSY